MVNVPPETVEEFETNLCCANHAIWTDPQLPTDVKGEEQ
jgi:hypothetical protein